MADRENRHRLLLIEDDPEFSHSLQLRLTKEKWRPMDVCCAQTLHEAMALLQKESFSVILLDITLPDCRGLETYRQIHQMSDQTPVVILTGWDDNELAIEAVRNGAEDYLVKSDVEGKTIARVLHHAIERNRIKKELAHVSSQLRETNLHLEKMTILDPLTELLNRRGFQQALTREVQWSERHRTPFYAMIIDIDRFKAINDSLGYAVGDILLREVAGILKKSTRMTDHLARIGGDEFVLLMPETSFDDSMKVAERIRLAVMDSTFMVMKDQRVTITASAGLMRVETKTMSIDELLARIHPLLKKSKNDGGNVITNDDPSIAFPPELEGSIERVVSVIREGLSFAAVKQPIYRLEDQSIVGYEFLSRLKSSSFNMPEDFFRIAIEGNMLTLVDRHCFEVCARACEPLEKGLRCHINLFPSTLVDVPVRSLIDLLSKNGAHQYCFELSEQQIFGDPFYLIESIKVIKDAGILLAVDDVGFGHSCLESLMCFEPDVIKLDRRCLRLSTDAEGRIRMLRKMVKIAEDLGAEVVAEGIETYDDLELLKKVGVPYGQGFLWGQPA
ncbi:MAG: diguanylate cyclase [Candidatus Omnitrophota bacterium]|jgi:diguanylate cyclase (GGDEF)-like protein